VPNSPSPRSSWQSNGGAREQASSIIPIAAAKADSIGRRNTNQKECYDGGATAVGSSASGQVVVARATGAGAA
jgi:hypothetical protein